MLTATGAPAGALGRRQCRTDPVKSATARSSHTPAGALLLAPSGGRRRRTTWRCGTMLFHCKGGAGARPGLQAR